MDGYIKLYRKLLDWEWYRDQNTKNVFLHLLLKACFRETKFKGTPVSRGSYIASIDKIAAELGLSRQTVRTALNHLKSTNEITIQSTNRFSVITIVNYCDYQGFENDEQPAKPPSDQQTSNKQLTNNQPTTNQPSEEEGKKVRKKEGKKQYADFVSMTNDEYSSLVAKVGDDGAKRCVEILDNYKGSKGKGYKSDYRAILSWVISRYEQEPKIKPKSYSIEEVEKMNFFNPLEDL